MLRASASRRKLALSPTIGYEQSSAVAAEALRTGRPITELVLERGLLTRTELDRLLEPANLVRPIGSAATTPTQI